jgi:hypothetical protein
MRRNVSHGGYAPYGTSRSCPTCLLRRQNGIPEATERGRLRPFPQPRLDADGWVSGPPKILTSDQALAVVDPRLERPDLGTLWPT